MLTYLQNIEKAKKDIEKLEQDAEAANAAASSAPANRRGPRQDRSKKIAQKDAGIDDSAREVNVNADAVDEAEKEGESDAAKDLKAAKLEESAQPDVATA